MAFALLMWSCVDDFRCFADRTTTVVHDGLAEKDL